MLPFKVPVRNHFFRLFLKRIVDNAFSTGTEHILPSKQISTKGLFTTVAQMNKYQSVQPVQIEQC